MGHIAALLGVRFRSVTLYINKETMFFEKVLKFRFLLFALVILPIYILRYVG